MLRSHAFQTGTILLLTACGADVAKDGAQTPGGNANGGQGATGGNGSSLSGGLLSITPAQWNEITLAACVGLNSNPEGSRYLMEFVVDTNSTMTEVTPNSSPKSKWEVTRDALSAALDSFPDNTAVGLLLCPNKNTVPNASTTPFPVNNCVNVAAAVSPQALGAAGSAPSCRFASRYGVLLAVTRFHVPL